MHNTRPARPHLRPAFLMAVPFLKNSAAVLSCYFYSRILRKRLEMLQGGQLVSSPRRPARVTAEGELDGDRRPLAGLAVYLDGAVVDLGDPPGDGQPQAVPAHPLLLSRELPAVEAVEHVVKVFLADAVALVLDRDNGLALLRVGGESHRGVIVAVLEAGVEEDDEELHQAVPVPGDRHLLGDEFGFDAARLGGPADPFKGLVQDGADVVRAEGTLLLGALLVLGELQEAAGQRLELPDLLEVALGQLAPL